MASDDDKQEVDQAMAKAKPKSKNPFTGIWHILSMSGWDQDSLNEEVQAFIEFDEQGCGSFQFGLVEGQIDDYRTKKRDGQRAVQFAWDGEDGLDGMLLKGIGWAMLEGDQLKGTISIDEGEEPEFVAQRLGDKKPSNETAAVSWGFAPEIPTYDFFEGGSLDDMGDLQEAVEGFVYWLEEDRFLTWEAVACEEQGLRLTSQQKELLDGLLSFNDDAGEDILYIDEIPRTSEPWHAILNKIVPHLLMEPYRTAEVREQVKRDGWNRIVSALREHGEGLSLPPGVESCEEVVPADLRHKLRLQGCFDSLAGLGHRESSTLENPHQQDRVDWFIECLRESKVSVAYFGLTLKSLLDRMVLPAKDQPILFKMMQDKLGLAADDEQIAGRL